tara:strand:- start:102 stop:425 length:324 start_codon:yes stop_codon:yes gene_type:complete
MDELSLNNQIGKPIKRQPRKRGIYANYHDLIYSMRKQEFTVQEIHEELESRGVKSTYKGLKNYCRHNVNFEIFNEVLNGDHTPQSEVKKESTKETSENSEENEYDLF